MLLRLAIVSNDPAREAYVRDLVRGLDVVDVPIAAPLTSDAVSAGPVDLIIADRESLPANASDLLAKLHGTPERTEVLVLAGREDPTDRAELLEAGCYAVLPGSVDVGLLRSTIEVLVDRRGEQATERVKARRMDGASRLDDFISQSPVMQRLKAVVERVVGVDSTLLLQGETGTGKERLARAVHAEGPRSAGPFIAINCGALPEALLESELFGHEKGAFTGAVRSRRGYFELAHSGTVMLDEIGEMALPLQVKLLRVLETRRVHPVGSERGVPVDVRIIAATNRDLLSETQEGRFRSDLYYRLAVMTLVIPPLRDRRGDIPPLVRSYVGHFALQLGKSVKSVDSEAMEVLEAYDWPGNVRELMNVIERAVLLCHGDEITVAELPESIPVRMTSAGGVGALDNLSRGLQVPREGLAELPWRAVRARFLEGLERAYLAEVLQVSNGRVGDAARRAGLNTRSLFEKMRKYGLSKETFRLGIDDEV